jgi:ParB/RepB/Spo0J family partition protein
MSSDSRLPDSYDKLIPTNRLRHGTHNVRRASPSEQLKRSIEKDGLTNALTVRDPGGGDAYHITDGWQRYQAAVELGWDELPVNVYEDTLSALEAAEAQSIVREWTTYQAAQHVQSLYSELTADGINSNEAAEVVAERTARSKPTVRRYLRSLRLPEDLQPLLKTRQNITATEWQTLKNYREDIRRYDGLSWKVAEVAGQHSDDLADDRLRRVLLATPEYTADDGKRLIREAARDPEAPLEMLRYRLFDGAGSDHNYIRIPQTGVRLEDEKKEAVMDYCHEQKVHLSDVVERQVRQFAERVESDQRDLEEFQT